MKKLIIFLILFFGVFFMANETYAMDKENENTKPGSMKTYAIRLKPGQDLKQELTKFFKKNNLKAGVILTCVGSLKQAKIRFSDRKEGTLIEGKNEIVSLTGTLSPDGNHFHISISDENGKTIGGHVMDGCIIYTTAEIVIGDLEDVTFSRETDPETTFKELVIRKKINN